MTSQPRLISLSSFDIASGSGDFLETVEAGGGGGGGGGTPGGGAGTPDDVDDAGGACKVMIETHVKR